MMEKPLISIAMATYNGEKFLSKQLDSIFSQTYENIEVIVCDDASTDKTVDILKDYSKKYSNLKYYINQKRLGVVKNFEKALSLSNGDFIALSDQDDIWLPDKLDILYKNIEDNLIILSDAYIIDDYDNIIYDSFIDYIKVDKSTNFVSFLFGSRFPGCTFLINRKLLDYALPFPNSIPYHDWWLNLIASKIGKVKFLDNKLTYYRLHGNNTTGAFKANFKNLLKYFLTKGDTFLSNHSLMLESVLKSLENNLSDDEKQIIYDLIEYNKRKDKYLAFKSFYIYLKYYKYFSLGKKGYLKLIILFSSLFGFKTIKILKPLVK